MYVAERIGEFISICKWLYFETLQWYMLKCIGNFGVYTWQEFVRVTFAAPKGIFMSLSFSLYFPCAWSLNQLLNDAVYVIDIVCVLCLQASPKRACIYLTSWEVSILYG